MLRILRFLGMSVEKTNIGHLPRAARVYIACLGVAAVGAAACAATAWRPVQGEFFFYLVCGILCSNMKVWLPGITGTLSVNYIFILASATELCLPQTVLIAMMSGVAQLFSAARKRPRTVQIAFTCASMTLSSSLMYEVYHARLLFDSVPFRLFWASIAYFLLNTSSVGTIVALTEGKKFIRLWLDNFFWTAPHYLVGGSLAGLLHFWDQTLGWRSSVLVFPTVYLIYHSYQLYLKRLEEEKRHVGEMADLHLRTIQALALAIDAKDGTTHGHLRRVQIYARELARELGLSEEDRRALDAAALLHDIGKLAVPEHIISKPGKLTPEEFEKMKVHPIVGAEILESVQFPYAVAPIVRAHHEKWDGTGYPYGLKGEEIPIGARIVSAVDCLDALASDRQYRRALPLDEAMRSVAGQSGTSFDPAVVAMLERRYKEFEAMARKRPVAQPRLSKSVRIDRGGPGSGFERSDAPNGSSNQGFVAHIAAARQEFQTLLELTNDLGSSLRMDETLALLASRLRAAIPYDGIAIYTVEAGRLRTRYASGEDAVLFSSLEIPLGEGISGWVTQNNKPMVNGNPSVEPGYLCDPTKFSVHRSALSVPLPGIEGVIGALTLYHRKAGAFTKDHLRMLLAVSSKAGLTIENAMRFVRAEETATTDGLTGLPNARSLFLRLDAELEKARAGGSRLAVLVADMDGFKQVNDAYGHAAGNRVLQRTGQTLRETCRDGDYAARMGGDEFVLLAPHAEPGNIHGRLRQLNDLVAKAGREACRTDLLGLSVGAAFYPEDGNDAEELLAKADQRMYEMKRQHHGESAAVRGLTQMASALESLAYGSVDEELKRQG
ncbi:MAG TPA: HD domain-containing phosphohydrolase [Bryobacteraceae bacterium]|nr:HD domain-containing phosphohydrolase [Bryobacteraceae bacterium]